MHEALGSIPAPYKLDMVVNFGSGGRRLRSPKLLHGKLKAKLNYMRPCLKNIQKKKKKVGPTGVQVNHRTFS